MDLGWLDEIIDGARSKFKVALLPIAVVPYSIGASTSLLLGWRLGFFVGVLAETAVLWYTLDRLDDGEATEFALMQIALPMAATATLGYFILGWRGAHIGALAGPIAVHVLVNYLDNGAD